jgi:predicted deacetylase
MSLHRYAAKRDATEVDIVKALRQVGADVLLLGAFDLLVLFRGSLFMLDAKSRTGRPTASQRRLSQRGWPLHYVRTPEDALQVIGVQR